LHHFVACVDPALPIVNDSEDMLRSGPLRMFPFRYCAYLLRDQEPSKASINNHLETLFAAQVPSNNKGIYPKMQFRKTINMSGATHRVFCVYNVPAQQDTDISNKSLYIRNMQKLKDFLVVSTRDDPGRQITHSQKQNFRKIFLEGDAISFNVFNEAGQEDTIVAAAQFKCTNHGLWINYLSVTSKPVTNSVYGIHREFLPENTSFQGIGLAFTLLRAIQLIGCCLM
jgi:hypothetical protein